MIENEIRDLGIPLPGSDPERRNKIKIEIHRMKANYFISPWETDRKRGTMIQPSMEEVKG